MGPKSHYSPAPVDVKLPSVFKAKQAIISQEMTLIKVEGAVEESGGAGVMNHILDCPLSKEINIFNDLFF